MLSIPMHRFFNLPLVSSVFALSLSLQVQAAQEPLAITPTIRSVNLQMMRNADQDSAQLSLELVARFADGRLLGWSDVQIISLEGQDGIRLTGEGHGTTTLLQTGMSEDDLNIPLTLELANFIQPPLSLKKVRISAIALIGHGATRELTLPATANGRTFAPADNRAATVTATAEKDHWRLSLSGPLAERCVKIVLRNEDGSENEANLNQNQISPQRVQFDLQPNNGDMTGTHPVLELVEKIERRLVMLSSDHLDLFASNSDPELLPLGGDPKAIKAPIVPAPDGTTVEIVGPKAEIVAPKAEIVRPKKDF